MARKLRIAIVGAGNLGSALALALHEAGFVIDAMIGRSGRKSRTKTLASRLGARALISPEGINADVLWFCVPDAEIARMARAFAGKVPWKGKVALHSSGALTSAELDALRRRGAATASVHPLMTFVTGSRPSLKEVPFAVEGDASAVRIVRAIVRRLGGKAYSIRRQDKAAYHAWGTFASPLLTALLAATEEVATLAGVNRKVARERMLPILSQTLSNYSKLGAAGSFSGPIIRGDIETVRCHLGVLQGVRPVREVYVALARAAVQYLPAKNTLTLKRVLGS